MHREIITPVSRMIPRVWGALWSQRPKTHTIKIEEIIENSSERATILSHVACSMILHS